MPGGLAPILFPMYRCVCVCVCVCVLARVRCVRLCACVVCAHAWPKRSGLAGSVLSMYGLGRDVGESEGHVSLSRSLSLSLSLARSFARALSFSLSVLVPLTIH